MTEEEKMNEWIGNKQFINNADFVGIKVSHNNEIHTITDTSIVDRI